MCLIVKAVCNLLLSGQAAYSETYTLAHLPDDMTIGLTIGESRATTSSYNIVEILGILLGYNLTDVDDNVMKNQYDGMYSMNVEELTKYVSCFMWLLQCVKLSSCLGYCQLFIVVG